MEQMLQSLQEERYKNEQLSNEVSDMYHQWHDLTELHQNEVSGGFQVIWSWIIDYFNQKVCLSGKISTEWSKIQQTGSIFST